MPGNWNSNTPRCELVVELYIYKTLVFKTSKGNQKMQFQGKQLSWPKQKGQKDNAVKLFLAM